MTLRRLPIGAELQASGGAHFRVWAPARSSLEVVVDTRAHPMRAEPGGYFAAHVDAARAGSLYRFRVDRRDEVPDPASRFQPEGPHGPSQVVDPSAYTWNDGAWRGVSMSGQVIYELHVGTFTPGGTFASAMVELPRLADVGVTLIEVMPIADFGGKFGWGYDGVNLYAPTRLYGAPDDFRRFVDAAHGVGIGVILDVVYNHFGPDGNYLGQLSSSYTTDRYSNDWGEGIAFDGDAAAPVREFFVANAGYWIDEFHLDGLRLDATQAIHDRSREHVIAAIQRRAREAAGARSIVLVAENEPQKARLLRPVDRDGYGLDAMWNDDFHHSAVVAATGWREAYYSDHRGTPQELISALKWGFLFQGQRYAWQEQPRGTMALDLPASAFVTFLENHDQVANTNDGSRLRLRTTPGRWRALTALVLLAPGTPMLFQGAEFASSAPFLFFADHRGELGAKVREGRAEFLRQFPSYANDAMQAALADPTDEATFLRCKLDPKERDANVGAVALHRDLLRLRREDPAFSSQRAELLHGAVIELEAFLLRFMCDAGDRLLVINLGADLDRASIAEPLLAPVPGRRWEVLWSSEDPRYGGAGTPRLDADDGWHIPSHAAFVLMPSSKRATP